MNVFFRQRSFLVPFVSCIVVMFYLYGVQDYATGYGFQRVHLWQDVKQGYLLERGEWSFGRFVPFAVLGLLFTVRKEILEIPVKPALWLGGGIILFALFLYFGGYKANQKYVGFMSGQLLVAGLILWFLGRQFFFKLFWLWCLLGMMWPWIFLIEPISFPLRIIMVKITSAFLSLIGVDVILQGSSIMTDTLDPKDGDLINLNIAAACSGLRSLFALVMIGLIIGYLQLKEDWKRVVLMICVPIVAVIGNFMRMLMLYFGAKFAGSEFAIGLGEGKESSYHINSGLVVFMVAVLLMLTIVQILNRGMKYFERRKLVVSKTIVESE